MRAFFILLFVFAGFSNVFAQSQTAYEKEVLEIKVKYLSILYYGYEKEMTLPEKQYIESLIKGISEEQEAALLADLVMTYTMTYSDDAPRALYEMTFIYDVDGQEKSFSQNELSQVPAGATFVERKQKLIKDVYPSPDNLLRRFQNEMEAAEKLKTDVDLKREKEKKTKIAQKDYEKTDRGSLQKNIKSAFLNWSQKGEFEKQADYEVRIRKQSQSKFTEICIEEIKKKINSFRSSDLSVNLLTYDSEKEVFPTLFKFKGREWKTNQKISIDKAQNFKEKEWQKFQWQKEKSSWCFIGNDMFPSKIYLESTSFRITFNLPLPNQEEVTVTFNNLEIENPYLKGFIFNYSTIKENKEEIEETIIEPSETSQVAEIVEIHRVVESPVFPGCENKKSNQAKKDCMSEKINQFISEKFDTDLANDLGLSGRQRIFVQFKIDEKGNVTNISARAPHPRLESEAKDVISQLPKITPGKLNGKPVGLLYSTPILFQVGD